MSQEIRSEVKQENGFTISTTPEDQRVEEARARLSQARRRTRGTLVALRVEIAEQTDWRSWVRARPSFAVLGAFVVGFLIGYRR